MAADSNTIPAEHFTFSTMVIPAGNEGPSHLHTDVEEVFFLIRGKLKLVLEKDGQRFETILTDRDCRCEGPSLPAGMTMVEKVKFSDGMVLLSAATPVPPVPM